MKNIKNLYIHFPFCLKKCHFCDFSVYSLAAINGTNFNFENNFKEISYSNTIEKYIENLSIEFNHFSFNYSDKMSNIETVYIGGGNPGMMSSKYLERILNSLEKNFSFDKKNAEITLESDPNSFDKEKLNEIYDLGINRINLGIQTFNDEILCKMNRSHNLSNSFTALDDLLNSNFKKKFGIELLQGLPESNFEIIQNDIENIILNKYNNLIPHIAISNMSFFRDSQIEKLKDENEPDYIAILDSDEFKEFRKFYFSHKFTELSAENYIYNHNLLTKNYYDHYEITHYALIEEKEISLKNKNYSKHNLSYLDGESEYIGFGAGASSFFMKKYFKKPIDISSYQNFIDQLKGSKFHKGKEFHFDNDQDMLEKYILNKFEKEYFENLNTKTQKDKHLKLYILNQMRRRIGFNLSFIRDNFDKKIYSKIENFFQKDFYQKFVDKYKDKTDNNEYIRVKFPEGALILDELLRRLFDELDLEDST